MRRSLLAVLCLVALPAAAGQPSVEQDESYDLISRRTFAFDPAGRAPAEDFGRQRIEFAVAEQLTQRGLRQVPAETAELIVATDAIPEPRRPRFSIGVGVGGSVGPVGVGVGGAAPIDGGSSKRTLSVRIRDRVSQQTVWQATVRSAVVPNPRKAVKRIDKAVRSAFRRYPSDER